LQWLIPFAVAAIVVLALVLFVNHETTGVPQIATVSPSAAKEENRVDTILVRQQQAPHTARLAVGESAVKELRSSITTWMTHQISLGNMNGPIKRLACRTTAGSTSARMVYSCDLTASAALTYPFDGVIERSTGAITWCQRVTPPIPSMNVPVSPRCT
jgi:hypothetical protein